ncbi:MAG: 2-hydroxyacyl-CoA dehydratase, partial [Candidatus Schekmanbacteria bacterium]|nr:2-hydroxyacyl-CoA dehydratase [Candidatus Schekmanbacteria bacterium]
MEAIGITSTIPLEIPLAAGCKVVDLNNLFISHPQKHWLVEQAEEQGFPRNTCCWIKGIYGVVRNLGIKTIIAVTEGDCSNTHALMEVLQSEGVTCIPFAYPYDRNEKLLRGQMEALMQIYGVSWEKVLECKKNLDTLRAKTWEIDRLTWQENKVSGWENHFYQVSCSDMGGDPQQFGRDLDDFMGVAGKRSPLPQKIRLGYLGVPPIFPELYEF